MSDDDVVAPGAPIAGHEPPERDITDGGPDMVQFLAADGTRVEVTDANAPYAAYLDEVDPTSKAWPYESGRPQ